MQLGEAVATSVSGTVAPAAAPGAALLAELSESVRLRQTACGLMPRDCVLFD